MPLTRKTFHFVLAVWGDSYVDTLLDIALPSFLAPGNIPRCAQSQKIEFHVYTRSEDQARIAAHPAWQELETHCECRLHPVLTPEQFERPNRYSVMSYCHQIAIRTARREGAVLSLLVPDCVIADGGLAFGAKLIARGFKAVMVTGPRGEMEAIAPVLSNRWRSPDSMAIRVPNRALMQLLIDHPHPISRRLFWDAEEFSAIPSAIYFHVGKGSILAKHFHLHPLFIDLSDAPPATEDDAGTVDGPLLRLAGINENLTYVVTNSDDMAIIELSHKNHDWMGGAKTHCPTWRVVNWMLDSADPDHRRNFLEYNMRFVGEHEEDWRQANDAVHRRTIALRQAILLSLKSPRLFERGVRTARSALRFFARCRQHDKIYAFSRAKLIAGITWYQAILAPRIAKHAAWIYWPLAVACRMSSVRFLVNMPAGMGHNTLELDNYLRRKQQGEIPQDRRIILFRYPNAIHRDSERFYRNHFWWIPTSRLIYCLLLPLTMRFHDITLDGGMSRLKWQLRPDLTYARPVADQTYLHQVSKDSALENWKSYYRLRAQTPAYHPLAEDIGMDDELRVFLDKDTEKLALFHIKFNLSNATGAASDAQAYLQAMADLRANGFKLVFVGREKMPPEFKELGVLNYAESAVASYRHDVQIFNAAAVAVTAGSGIAFLPDCLDVPYVYANSWHIGMPMCSPRCVIVPSLVQDRTDGRILSFAEQADLYWSMPDDGHEAFPMQRYDALNATAADIASAVIEALALGSQDIPRTALQEAYTRVDSRGLLAVTQARVCAHFIKMHQNLLEDGRLLSGAEEGP